MVEVEEGGVGALEEERSPAGKDAVEEMGGVGDVGRESPALFEADREHGGGVEREGLGGEAREHPGLESAGAGKSLGEQVGAEKVADADGGGAVGLVGVGGPDAAFRGADAPVLSLAREQRFADRILLLVVGHDDMGAVGEGEVEGIDAGIAQCVDLAQEGLGIDDDAVADDGEDALVKDSRGEQVQGVSPASDDDGVTGVGAAVVAHHGVKPRGEQVDDLPLPLVAPLEADHRQALAGNRAQAGRTFHGARAGCGRGVGRGCGGGVGARLEGLGGHGTRV